jgi:phage/plasmid-associated DNA primase
MPRPTTTIKATELYFNKDDITTLLNVDTQSDIYPKDDDDNFITKKEQTKLRNIIHGSKFDFEKNCYKKQVDFQKMKYGDISYGRLYSNNSNKKSIQGAKKIIRNVLFDKRVIGIDLVNSQPNVLLQLVKKHCPNEEVKFLQQYVEHRDTVRNDLMNFYNVPQKIIKKIIISLCFGQDINVVSKRYKLTPNEFITGFYEDTTLIKTKLCRSFPKFDEAEKVFQYRKDKGLVKPHNTIENSSIAMYLQNIEGEMMLTIYDAIKNDIQVVTVIHDEICFEINEFVKNNKGNLMCKMEETVRSKLGYEIVLQDSAYIKDKAFIDNHAEFKRQLKEEPDDIRNGRALYEILKDKARNSDTQGKWMYDDVNGLWTPKDHHFKRIVYRHAGIFVQTKTDKDGFIIEHHERDIGSMYRNIMEYFWTLVDNSDKLNSDKNRGFLLFKNGVLDCFNMEMLPFDPKYDFTKHINREFDIDKDYTEDMAIVKQKIFETAYTTGDGNTEKMDYFMEILAVALMEGGVDKEYLTMLGETNSGKGVLTAFLQNAFDEFISTFNTSVLTVGQNSNLEDASKWRFLTFCYDTRIMIGNEIAIQSDETTNAFGHHKRTERPLNTDMIKMLVSGGDPIKARLMRENEITIVNKAFVLMLANDLPKTSGDKAYAKRTLVIKGCRSSTTEEGFDEQLFFKADNDIKTWIENTDTCDALIALMCDTYKKVKYNRTKTPEWVLDTVKEYVECLCPLQWVKDNYDVYEDDVLTNFGAEKTTEGYKVDWKKVGNWCVRADVMYNLYKDSGGTDSQVKFGKMLTDNGIIKGVKSLKGTPVKHRIGVAMKVDELQLREGGDDENIDDYTPKKREHYPPSNYVPPPVEPKQPSNQRTIIDMVNSSK